MPQIQCNDLYPSLSRKEEPNTGLLQEKYIQIQGTEVIGNCGRFAQECHGQNHETDHKGKVLGINRFTDEFGEWGEPRLGKIQSDKG